MGNFTTSDGLSLYYSDTGSGLPILCLAGLTRCSDDFCFVAPHLSGHRLIMLDYRGRGRSDWAKDISTYSVPREAQDALELLDHLGLESCAVLGTSRGGMIAMFMAATAKSRLLGVALNDVGPELAAKDLKRIFNYLGVPPTERSWADAAKSRAAQMPGFENVPHARWMQEVKNMFDQSAGGLSLRYNTQLREAVRHSFTEPSPDLWPLFDALDGVPLCLLRGANSNLLSAQTSQKMFEKHPDMIKTEVPDRGHTPFLDEPEALEALHRWIKVMKK